MVKNYHSQVKVIRMGSRKLEEKSSQSTSIYTNTKAFDI